MHSSPQASRRSDPNRYNPYDEESQEDYDDEEEEEEEGSDQGKKKDKKLVFLSRSVLQKV